MNKRNKPFASVTWLAKLMAGEKLCHYSFWLQTHYQFEKKPSTYNPSEHDEMVQERAKQLSAEGFTVYVENENNFSYEGQMFKMLVKGRPDIMAVKDGWVVVEDIKTGKRCDSHRYQILLYMFLLTFSSEMKHRCKGQIPHGRLIYRDDIVEIPVYSVNRTFKEHLRKTVAILADNTPPNPTANSWECRYCQVPFSSCQAKSA